MVRFSDMLGGSDDSQAPPPTAAPLPDPPAAEPDETPEEETPEEVLDRLTQYAAEHSPEPEPPSTAAGDDLLPHAKGRKRR